MPEETPSISTAQSILEKFKMKTAVVEYEGERIKIKKVPVNIIFTNDLIAVPIAKDIIGRWKTMTTEQRMDETADILKDPVYKRNLVNLVIMAGSLDPVFTDQSPVLEGQIPVNELDEEFREFLSSEILRFSSMDKKSSEFFQSGSGVPSPLPGSGSETVSSAPESATP